MIQTYNDFCRELLTAGFTFAGADAHIFSIIGNNWNEAGLLTDDPSLLRWHTGDPETDPWEWRMRVLEERNDIAYAKVFMKKAGFITKEWYPYFLAARRGGCSFAEAYADGTISHFAKRIYEAVAEHGSLPLDGIKRAAGFSREDKSKFDTALTELQMRLYVTIQGQQLNHAWPSTVFCTTEEFWSESDVFTQADELSADEAVETITRRVLERNPAAQEKKIAKFIRG